MSDLRTVFIDMDRGADLALEQFALATDDGIETAVIHALFTDARADDGDLLPDGQTDRRGWWGDGYPTVEGDRYGSKLWLLGRSKQLSATLVQARQYAEEALAHLVDDGVAGRVEVEASIPRDAVLGLTVQIYRPDGTVARYRYETLWNRM